MSDQSIVSRLAESRRQRVLSVLEGLTVSPTTINVPMRVLHLQRSRSAGLRDFGDALQADAALSTKILALANSSFFSPSKTVTRISDAVGMIGLNNLLPLVFGLSLAGIFNPTDLPPSERASLWRTALLKGVVARLRCRLLGGSDIEEAFLCGLFQDIALPAMFAADRAAAIELVFVLDTDERLERERLLFGGDHTEFGEILLKRLGVPDMYVRATATHHDPDSNTFLPIQARALIQAVRLAAAVPHRVARSESYQHERMRACFGDATDSSPISGAITPELSTEESNEPFFRFLRDVGKEFSTITGMLGEGDESGMLFKVFLQQVSDQIARSMQSAIGESTREITQLRQSNDQMLNRLGELESRIQDSDVDPLTEAFNRRGFLERAPKVFDLAREFGHGCMVGFIDLDDFKQINDRFGHDAGDIALQVLARTLREVIHNHGVVGRCGGDEFVFAATCDPAQQQTLAGALDGAMKGIFHEMADGRRVPLTTSVGIVWIESPQPADTIHVAMKRADQLMYDAKRGGKARCVVGSNLAA